MCPRGEIGRHKGLKTLEIHIFNSLCYSQRVQKRN